MREPALQLRIATAALLTPSGRGAVATLRFEGDCRLIGDREDALFRAANGKRLSGQPLGRIVFGHWGADPPEDVVVCRLTEQTLEIHCHGGDAAARRVLDGLASAGCRILPWREMLADSLGIFDAECLEALTRATTERAALILLQQPGLLRRALDAVLRQCSSGAQCASRGALPAIETHATSISSRLDELLSWARFGLHLTGPWNVVLAGRPNVGKSSLINALVGYARTIVFDEPGTTRDVVTVETALDGWPVQLSDTAGLRDNAERLEAAGIERARAMLSQADCRVLLFDVSVPPTADDRRLRENWPDAILVAHKCDLPAVWGGELPAEVLRVSSTAGQGLEDLARAIVSHLVPRVPPPETAIPITVRQVELLRTARSAAEAGEGSIVRETLHRLLGMDEVETSKR